MKVLMLFRYGRLGASSRLRSYANTCRGWRLQAYPLCKPRCFLMRSAGLQRNAKSPLEALQAAVHATRARCIAAAQKHFSLDEGVRRYAALYGQLGGTT